MDSTSLQVTSEEMLETNSLIRIEKTFINWKHWNVACKKFLDNYAPFKQRAKLKPYMTQEIMKVVKIFRL